MNIGKSDVKRIKRIFQKYKVSFEFVLLNFSKVIQLYKYVTGHHVVIKRKLVKKKNKVVIKYNTLRKSLFSWENKKKRQNSLPWSTRAVQFIKKKRVFEKNQDEIENIVEIQSDSLSPEEIQKKLKEQLELLKSGKKTVPLIGGKDDEFVKTATITVRDINSLRDTNLNETQRGNAELECNDELENIIYSQRVKNSNERLSILPDYAEESNGTQSSPDEDPLDTDTSANMPFTKSMKFLDLLINKMQIADNKKKSKGMNVTNTTIQQIDETSQNSQKLSNNSEFKNQLNKESVESSNDIESMDYSNYEDGENILQIEINEIPSAIAKDNENAATTTTVGEETSSSSSEFLGFTDYELVPSTVPGMLPTPIVANSKKDSQNSAFVSEDLDNFLRENSLQRVTSPRVEVPKRYKSHEEGLMCDGATPPKMIMPVIPEELIKPRTVAEKRYILQRKQSIKYYMIENENTIYRELKKRTKYGKANTAVVRCIQNLEVPCTRDCWKASAWLCTENGRFYFQMLKVDNVIVKLVGGSGNHATKYKRPQLSRPPKNILPKVCSPGCRQNVDFRNIVINLSDDEAEIEKKEKIEHDIKLQIGSVDQKYAQKPGPLSSKCMFSPFQPNMGELQVYEMPKVKLEVFPEVDKPLDDAVKPYLKYILPSNCITREWAEFAVSTVILKAELIQKEHPKSFTFTIPYLNNQNNILVRKMYNRREKMEKFSTKDFDFRKEVEPDDEIASECADILSEMINSVAIGLSEDSLLKDDPDIDYSNNTRVNEETVRRDSSEEKVSEVSEKRATRTKKNKLVMELKKLNATVIDAESLCSVENKRCKIPHCRFGCVCQSISGKPIQRKYCKKTECMLLSGSCKHMASTDIGDLMNSSLTTENALLIRRKATEKLAKVEKEFCATVVLTDKETFVLNEPTKERKRSKRIPKRFDDYDTTEGKENISGYDDEESITSIPKLYPFDDEPPPKKFKHCTVDLYKLHGLENIEPWCMIHCLYKCFCKGESTTGVPFEIKKEETIVSEEIAYPRRPIYSFDKETSPNKKNFLNSEQNLLKRRNDEVDSSERYDSPSKMQKTDIDTSSCRRIMPIPASMYQFQNHRRATQVRRTIRTSENDSTNFILSDRMQKSLQFPTIFSNNRSLLKTNQSYKRRREDSDENTKETGYTPEIESNKNEAKFPVISSVCSLSEVPELNLKLHRQSSMHPSETSSNCSGDVSPFLKSGDKNADTSSDFLTNPPETSSFINQLPANATRVNSQFHNQVINKLNLAVTRSMHSICTIQLSNTKKIPDPVLNTLSCHQWNLFLQAYVEGTIYIWEIKTNNGSFLAATVTNLMPMIPNALSVINIKAISKHKLPLVGKMLNARFINDKTKTLSVLLTGHHGYWRIIGFIHSTYDYLRKGGYFKPTPQSHPCLSKKINLLYNIMILRQIHSTKTLIGQKATATITSQQLASETEPEGSEENTLHNESRTESSVKNISTNINTPELYTITSPVPSIAVSDTYAEESVTQLNISENRTISESCASTSSNLSSPVPSIAQVPESDKNHEGNAFKADRETVGLPITPKCNLEIKRVSYKTIEGIVIPIAIPGDHRWLVLDIVGDFSHIYIPDWKNFLSYDKIKKAIMLTQRTRKIVRIGQDESSIDVFATPDIRDRIYLGPYAIGAGEDIVLYQNIDGRMMLREDFEISHNISRKQRTCGFWLYKKFGKLIFDIDLKSLHISKVPLDDDCVIVDDKGDSVSEETENVYAIIEDSSEEFTQKLDVAQQPIKPDLPLHIDLDSVRTLHEFDGEKEKKSEVPKMTPLLKPWHVTTMQVAKISTKRGISNLKIIKNIEASSLPEKSTSSDQFEMEISEPANETLIPQTDLTKEMHQPRPVVPKPKDLQVSECSKKKQQYHPIASKSKDQVGDVSISEEKDQSQPIDPKPKDLQICDVSISPISQHSSDTKCYGPMTASQHGEPESATAKFRGTLVSSISKQSLATKCYGPAPGSKESEQQNRMRRNSLSSPVSLLIQAMNPSTSIITKKTGSSSIPLIQKMQSKPDLVTKLIPASPAQIATPTSNATLIKSQRPSNSITTIITKASSPAQSSFSVTKPGSSTNQLSPANVQTSNTKVQTVPKTIILNRKADAQVASEGSNRRESTVTISNLDGLKTVKVTNANDKNKILETDGQTLSGYVVCEDPKLGSFPAKRLGDFYFLKMPGTKGVYRLKGMDMVNKYLNCHIKKQSDSAENMCWSFLSSKDLRRRNRPILKNDQDIFNGSSTKSAVTSTITSTTQQDKLSRKYVLTLAKNTNVLHQIAVADSLTLETESKLQKLKNFTVKKTAIIKNPKSSILTKEKWIKVQETPVETVTTMSPNSLLRKVLSLPVKLPPVPPPEKTATLLTPPTVKTPPPATVRISLSANSKTPPPENVKTPPPTIVKIPPSATVTTPLPVAVTKPPPAAVKTPLPAVVKTSPPAAVRTPPPLSVPSKLSRPFLPISIKPVKPVYDEVILIDDDE